MRIDLRGLICAFTEQQCGDSDWLIGYAKTKAEAWDLLKDVTDINGSGGWNYDYVVEFLDENWDGDFTPTTHQYAQLDCPECGAQLDVYYDGPNIYNDKSLIRHCDECGCDWESELLEDGRESELKRKFWGYGGVCMGKFEKYSFPGTCAVCGKSTDVVVCASAFGATTYAYCERCLSNDLEPYHAMVDYISCAGLFPDDINPQYQNLCRHILKGLGISEEQFVEDVRRVSDDFGELNELLDDRFDDDFE